MVRSHLLDIGEGRPVGAGRVEVGEAHGEGVGGVGRRGFGESEHGADHEGDLLFISGAFSDDGLFYALWGVIVDGDAMFCGGDKGSGAGGAQGDGGFVALDIDGGFYGALVRGELGDGIVELFANGDEAA